MRNKIERYMHCILCIREKPADVAMRDWARLNVGATDNGLQVWCTRHNVNVAALDFRGQKVAFEGEDEEWGDPGKCSGCGAAHGRHKHQGTRRARKAGRGDSKRRAVRPAPLPR